MTEEIDPEKFKYSIFSSAAGTAINLDPIQPNGLSIYDLDGKPIFHMDGQGKLDYSITKLRQYINDYADKTADFPRYQNNIACLVAKAIVAVYDECRDSVKLDNMVLRQNLPGGGTFTINQPVDDPLTYFRVKAVQNNGMWINRGASVSWDVLHTFENKRYFWNNFLDYPNDNIALIIACQESMEWVLQNQGFVENLVRNNPALIRRK